jgi:DNA helicase-2/ATP-dependent DNA helicase PcrA
VDFDDLIAAPLKLLGAETGLRDAYRRRFPWISVDEYQDVDEAQYRLIRLLAPADANLCAIGDPDQAIYGFRGTDVRFFQRFREDFPSARIVTLKRNYRSVRPIVDASLQLVAPASLVEKRAMICLKGGAERVTVHEAASDRAEAEFIVHTIERMVGGSTFFSMDSGRVGAGEGESPAGGLAFCDFAVLYRTEAQSGALAEAFARSGLPFQRRSHGGLADDPQVAALLQAMQAAGDGGTVRERLAQAARAVAKAGVTAHADGDARGLAASFAGLAEECGSDLNRFLSEIAVGSDVDLWDPRAQRVPLLTLHAAKGMEFEVVFMAGCEEGLLPLHWGAPLPEQESEERRLFFVGMTRARRRLFLLHARKRMVNGRMRERAISPFLRDVEEALLERGRDALRAQGPRARQLELL